MKKFKILTTPTSLEDLESNEWYDNLNNSWELKAERFRARQRKAKDE